MELEGDQQEVGSKRMPSNSFKWRSSSTITAPTTVAKAPDELEMKEEGAGRMNSFKRRSSSTAGEEEDGDTVMLKWLEEDVEGFVLWLFAHDNPVGYKSETIMEKKASEVTTLMKRNSDGDDVSRGEGDANGGDMEVPTKYLFYCGKLKNQCRCGKCDGQCGPRKGCPCHSKFVATTMLNSGEQSTALI
jgi:hypothetical protein